MKTLAALLMLLAVEAHAATFTYNFNRSIGQMEMWPCNRIQSVHGPVSNGGITANFGMDFSFGIDCEDRPECPCPMGGAVDRFLYDFANEPSSGGVGAFCFYHPGGQEAPLDDIIVFDPPIRFFSMWYSFATGQNRVFQPPDCDWWFESPASQNTRVAFHRNPGEQPFVAWAPLDESGVSWETNCVGDPNGNYCEWHYVELVVPPNQPPVRYVEIGTSIFDPLYFDNITAATGDCPSPPCGFERAETVTPAARTSWGKIKKTWRHVR